MDKNKTLKDLFIFILLITLIITRIFLDGEDNILIKSMGYVGIILALVDLYIDAESLYEKNDKFGIIRGVSYALAPILAIVLVLFLTNIIPIDTMLGDIFTLAALLISLPEHLYLSLIGKYLNKKG